MAYTLNEEIKNALKTKDKRTKKAVEVVMGGKILKKYRLVRKVSSELGLCRNRIAEVKEKRKKAFTERTWAISRDDCEFSGILQQ